MPAASRSSTRPRLAAHAAATAVVSIVPLVGGCSSSQARGWTPELIAPTWSLARDGARDAPETPSVVLAGTRTGSEPAAPDAASAWLAARPPHALASVAR